MKTFVLLGSSLNVRRNQTITKHSSESELVRGRLKICSKSLVFVPQESADPSQPDTKPLLKFPLADCTKIEGKFALQCYFLNLKTSSQEKDLHDQIQVIHVFIIQNGFQNHFSPDQQKRVMQSPLLASREWKCQKIIKVCVYLRYQYN